VANVNRCLFIGRLGSDVEVRQFSGSKLGKFRFVVNNRKKNQSTGAWEDQPCWIDAEAWQSGQSTFVDRMANHLRKGMPVYLEARLELDQWNDQQGNKRSKHKLVITDWQFVEKKPEDAPQGGQQRPQAAPQRAPARPAAREPASPFPPDDDRDWRPAPGGEEEEIPF
jgi:single-strand DNA-binding protein